MVDTKLEGARCSGYTVQGTGGTADGANLISTTGWPSLIVQRPRPRTLALGTDGHRLGPIQTELRTGQTVGAAGLPATLVTQRADEAHAASRTLDQDMAGGITRIDQMFGGQQITRRELGVDAGHLRDVWRGSWDDCYIRDQMGPVSFTGFSPMQAIAFPNMIAMHTPAHLRIVGRTDEGGAATSSSRGRNAITPASRVKRCSQTWRNVMISGRLVT